MAVISNKKGELKLAGNKIICEKNNVDYIGIRMAMCKGARTKEEVKQIAGVCLECEGCKSELTQILESVCGCNNTSLKSVIEAINNGAGTVEEIGQKTGAGVICGRCTVLIENIIELGR